MNLDSILEDDYAMKWVILRWLMILEIIDLAFFEWP